MLPNRQNLPCLQNYLYLEQLILNGIDQINAMVDTFQNQAKGIDASQLQLIANEAKLDDFWKQYIDVNKKQLMLDNFVVEMGYNLMYLESFVQQLESTLEQKIVPSGEVDRKRMKLFNEFLELFVKFDHLNAEFRSLHDAHKNMIAKMKEHPIVGIMSCQLEVLKSLDQTTQINQSSIAEIEHFFNQQQLTTVFSGLPKK